MPFLPPSITSRTNARVKALRASLSGEARRPGDLLGLEGEHLLREARAQGLTLDTVYLREGSESILERGDLMNSTAAHWTVLSKEVFDSAVSTAAPQGIAATWVIQQPVTAAGVSNVLIADGLQDPGNLGTLIRSAFAFGMSKVMVTPETVNQWNPKTVRAAAGAIFRLPVERLPLEEIVRQVHTHGVRIFAAVASFLEEPGSGTPLLAVPNGVLVGRGSNVCAAETQTSAADPLETAAAATSYAASMSFDTDFVEPCAILIGNEGAGLSARARALADEQVFIPCHAESLNAAVAGSVLMYEVMRQRPLREWARRQGLRP